MKTLDQISRTGRKLGMMVCFYNPGAGRYVWRETGGPYSSLGQPALTNYRTSGSGRPGFKKKKNQCEEQLNKKKKKTCLFLTLRHVYTAQPNITNTHKTGILQLENNRRNPVYR